jgi:hypothetical protein
MEKKRKKISSDFEDEEEGDEHKNLIKKDEIPNKDDNLGL